MFARFILGGAAALALLFPAAPAAANHNCSDPKWVDHPHCAGGGGGDDAVTLEITFDFGELDGAGVCTAPACRSTTIEATGTVECNNMLCDFNATTFDPAASDLNLPEGLHTLLFATEWRGTPLDPDLCFGYPGTAEITSVFLRTFFDPSSPWDAVVGATAYDVAGVLERHYGFNFRGSCGEGCPDLPPSGEDVFSDGVMFRIDGKGPDKKFDDRPPCRCTMSNTPDCPDDVVDQSGEPIPSPPLRVTVTDITPL